MNKHIISVSGLIGSGKDTIADYLCTHHGFRRLSWAASLKDAAAAVFGWDRELLEGSTASSRRWREEVDVWWAQRLEIPHLTPRWVLQWWGTNVLREHFHNDIWVASLERKLTTTSDNVIITDSRFSNEIAAIKRVGGTTIRVERGPQPSWWDLAVLAGRETPGPDRRGAIERLAELGVHPSEWSSVGLQYDHIIDNNGTIEELHKQISQVLDLHDSK